MTVAEKAQYPLTLSYLRDLHEGVRVYAKYGGGDHAASYERTIRRGKFNRLVIRMVRRDKDMYGRACDGVVEAGCLDPRIGLSSSHQNKSGAMMLWWLEENEPTMFERIIMRAYEEELLDKEETDDGE